MKHRATIAAAVALSGLATLTVAAPPSGFKLVAETPHFAHYTRVGAKGGVGHREETLLHYEQLLGTQVSGRIEWYAYERPEQVAAATGHYLAGYFEIATGRLHATPEAEKHEIVHAVAYELGDPGSFFHEGLAVTLGNNGRLGGYSADREAKRLLRNTSPRALVGGVLQLGDWETSLVAASFVKWLIDQHGLPAVVAFFRACNRAGSPVAFAASFGQTLDQASTEWARSLGFRPSEPTVLMANVAP